MSMRTLFYFLILFIISCGDPPQDNLKETPASPPPSSQENAKQTDTEDDTEKSDPNSENPAPTAPQSNENAAQPTPQQADNPSPQYYDLPYVLNQISGSYQFPLDVYQNWMTPWTSFTEDDALITLNLVQNSGPQTKQLLIEVISPESPFGKFCVVQSNLKHKGVHLV